MEPTSNTHRLNYLAADSKVSGWDVPARSGSEQKLRLVAYLWPESSSGHVLPDASTSLTQGCKVAEEPLAFTLCCHGASSYIPDL